MRKLSLYILLPVLFCVSGLYAQQFPILAHYSFTPKYYNPAAQGGADGGGVGVVYRSQFNDLPQSSRPITYFLHADISPLINDRVGLGFVVAQDKVHLLQRTNITGFFGYHLLPTDGEFRLSLGAMAGWMTQSLDLGTATVNNPFDLALMQATEKKGQFDGGAGLQAQWVQENGSGLMLDAALPQLFTNDIEYPARETANGRRVIYGMYPHAIASLRYRWQAEAFALEPMVAWRESFGKKLKAANYDFGLRVAFLRKQNQYDMFTIGGGYRTDEGGLFASVAIRPIPSVNVVAAYENHNALGSTFELGAQYLFGGKLICQFGEQEKLAETGKNELMVAKSTLDAKVRTARERLESATIALEQAEKATNNQVQQSYLANADKALGDANTEYKAAHEALLKMEGGNNKAEQAKKNAIAANKKLCNADELNGLPILLNDSRNQERNVAQKLSDLQKRRSLVRPPLDPKDISSVRRYLELETKSAVNKPEDLQLRNVKDGEIEFQFADPNKTYVNGSSRSFAEFLAKEFADLKSVGITVESVQLIAEVQTRTITRATTTVYDGSYDPKLKLEYKANKASRPTTIEIKKDAVLTVEQLAVLKLYDFRRWLASKTGLPESAISMELTYPNPNQDYEQVTRVIIKYKK